MHADEFDYLDRFPSGSAPWAYEAVAAVVSDDHNFERGLDAARAVADVVLANAGPGGLTLRTRRRCQRRIASGVTRR
jgi:hypothetical protein